MTKPSGDPSQGPAPTPRPRTPPLVRRGVAALGLVSVIGCGGAEPVPPQAPPTPLPQDVTATPPQPPPPQVVQPPPQVAPPPQLAPPRAQD